MQPRIFISHSARGDPGTMDLLESLATELTMSGFSVRVDMEHIRLGDNWRHTLNTWIGGCDAAIVFLSEKALKSAFVAYETSILSYRAETSSLIVLPVFLDPVDYKAVHSSALQPSEIYRTQAVTRTSKQAIVAEIKDRLKDVQFGQTPIDEQAAYLCTLLQKVENDDDIKWGAAKLDVDLGTWAPPPDDIRRALALKMMCAGLDKVTPVIRRLLKYFSDQRPITEMINLVATSWVDLRAAEEITSISTALGKPRLLGTNAQTTRIADAYVLRASKDSSEDSWKVASVLGIVDDRPAETLVGQIRTSLKRILDIEEDGTEELEKVLVAFEKYHEPVFVALPADGLNRTLIEQLRTDFPTVTLFVLGGNNPVNLALVGAAGVPLLQPALDAGFEKTFCDTYDASTKFLQKRPRLMPWNT